MRSILSAAVFVIALSATASLAAERFEVVDYLQVSKTDGQNASVALPVKSEDIAAAQKCKDLGPASKDPSTEAQIINQCLARFNLNGINVTASPVMIKAMLR